MNKTVGKFTAERSGSAAIMASVAYAYYLSPKYREAFHYALREELKNQGVAYSFLYAKTFRNDSKGDTVDIPWAAPRRFLQARVFGRPVLWHAFLRDAGTFNLLITQQENRILTNYFLLALAPLFGWRIAYFGHGRNFQARRPGGAAERWKRFWATRAHWWFTYTDSCADLIEGYGFPRRKITVFNNAIDLSAIRSEVTQASPARLAALRDGLCGGSSNVAVYAGGMYPEKRLRFLVESLDEIRRQVPDFHALFMGSGPDEAIVRDAARTRPWIHCLGPKFGMEKTEYALLAKVWLMPGLVGLAVLDSFAYGTPIVTTAIDGHSPEFDYLEDGENGVVVKDSTSPAAYAAAVVRLLTDEPSRMRLVGGGAAARRKYSVEDMARRFADGVIAALE